MRYGCFLQRCFQIYQQTVDPWWNSHLLCAMPPSRLRFDGHILKAANSTKRTYTLTCISDDSIHILLSYSSYIYICGSYLTEFTIYSNSTYVDLTCVYMYYSFIYIYNYIYILLYIILYIILKYIYIYYRIDTHSVHMLSPGPGWATKSGLKLLTTQLPGNSMTICRETWAVTIHGLSLR